MSNQFYIIFPLPIKHIPIFVSVLALPIAPPIPYPSEVILILCEVDLCLPLQHVFLKLTFVLCVVFAPNVQSLTMFL